MEKKNLKIKKGGSLSLPSFLRLQTEQLSSPEPNDFASVPCKLGSSGVRGIRGAVLTGCQPCKAPARRQGHLPSRLQLAPGPQAAAVPGVPRRPHAVSRSHRSVTGTTPRAQHTERRRGAKLASPAVPGPSLRGVGARQLPSGSLPFCAQSQSGETSVFHKPRAEANLGLDTRAHATADPHTKSRDKHASWCPVPEPLG